MTIDVYESLVMFYTVLILNYLQFVARNNSL